MFFQFLNPPFAISNVGDFGILQDAYCYWERHEGMRGQILSGGIVLDGPDVFTGSLDSD
jgi:hypothetical protein